jgi:hypothetical protein
VQLAHVKGEGSLARMTGQLFEYRIDGGKRKVRRDAHCRRSMYGEAIFLSHVSSPV